MSVHFPTHQLPDSWFAVVTDVYNRELDRASKSPKQRTTVNGIAGNGTSTPSYIQYYDNLKLNHAIYIIGSNKDIVVF